MSSNSIGGQQRRSDQIKRMIESQNCTQLCSRLDLLLVEDPDNNNSGELCEVLRQLSGEMSESQLMSLVEYKMESLVGRLLLVSASLNAQLRETALSWLRIFHLVVKANTSITKTPWWINLENKTVPIFCELLSEIVQQCDTGWAEPWCLAVSLLCVNGFICSPRINDLLKVVEKAFKVGKRQEELLPLVFTVWRHLTDTFYHNNKHLHTKKVYMLIVTPLTSPMPSSSILEKLKTWKHVVDRFKGSTPTAIEALLEPFVEQMYAAKKEVSMSSLYPEECCRTLATILDYDNVYESSCGQKIIDCFPACVASRPTVETLLHFWKVILGVMKRNKWGGADGYQKCLFQVSTYLCQILKEDTKLGIMMLKSCVSSVDATDDSVALFHFDNIASIVSLTPTYNIHQVLADLLQFEEFRTDIYKPLIQEMYTVASINDENHKHSQQTALSVWILLADICLLWVQSGNNCHQLKKEGNNNNNNIKTCLDSFTGITWLLLKFPLSLLQAKWTGKIQRKWSSLLESAHKKLADVDGGKGKCELVLMLLADVCDRLTSSNIQPGIAADVCSHVFNIDKSYIDEIMTIVNCLVKTYADDKKLIMDVLQLIELIMHYSSKNKIVEVLSNLDRLQSSSSLGEHRIWNKVAKIHRKLLYVKDGEENCKNDSEEEEVKEEFSSPKIRSPLVAHSNFLHRLGLAEKNKKATNCNNIVSVFTTPPKTSEGCDNNSELRLEDITKKAPQNKSTGQKEGEKENTNTETHIVKQAQTKEPAVEARNSKESKTDHLKGDNMGNRQNKIEGKTKEEENDCNRGGGGESIVSMSSPSGRGRLSLSSRSPSTTKTKLDKKWDPFADSMDTQDFVVVVQKPRKGGTPLTEHQKEMMKKRRDDIPALYHDLTQDTQSQQNGDANINHYDATIGPMIIGDNEEAVDLDTLENGKGGIKANQEINVKSVKDTSEDSIPGKCPMINDDVQKISVNRKVSDTSESSTAKQLSSVKVKTEETTEEDSCCQVNSDHSWIDMFDHLNKHVDDNKKNRKTQKYSNNKQKKTKNQPNDDNIKNNEKNLADNILVSESYDCYIQPNKMVDNQTSNEKNKFVINKVAISHGVKLKEHLKACKLSSQTKQNDELPKLNKNNQELVKDDNKIHKRDFSKTKQECNENSYNNKDKDRNDNVKNICESSEKKKTLNANLDNSTGEQQKRYCLSPAAQLDNDSQVDDSQTSPSPEKQTPDKTTNTNDIENKDAITENNRKRRRHRKINKELILRRSDRMSTSKYKIIDTKQAKTKQQEASKLATAGTRSVLVSPKALRSRRKLSLSAVSELSSLPQMTRMNKKRSLPKEEKSAMKRKQSPDNDKPDADNSPAVQPKRRKIINKTCPDDRIQQWLSTGKMSSHSQLQHESEEDQHRDNKSDYESDEIVCDSQEPSPFPSTFLVGTSPHLSAILPSPNKTVKILLSRIDPTQISQSPGKTCISSAEDKVTGSSVTDSQSTQIAQVSGHICVTSDEDKVTESPVKASQSTQILLAPTQPCVNSAEENVTGSPVKASQSTQIAQVSGHICVSSDKDKVTETPVTASQSTQILLAPTQTCVNSAVENVTGSPVKASQSTQILLAPTQTCVNSPEDKVTGFPVKASQSTQIPLAPTQTCVNSAEDKVTGSPVKASQSTQIPLAPTQTCVNSPEDKVTGSPVKASQSTQIPLAPTQTCVNSAEDKITGSPVKASQSTQMPLAPTQTCVNSAVENVTESPIETSHSAQIFLVPTQTCVSLAEDKSCGSPAKEAGSELTCVDSGVTLTTDTEISVDPQLKKETEPSLSVCESPQIKHSNKISSQESKQSLPLDKPSINATQQDSSDEHVPKDKELCAASRVQVANDYFARSERDVEDDGKQSCKEEQQEEQSPFKSDLHEDGVESLCLIRGRYKRTRKGTPSRSIGGRGAQMVELAAAKTGSPNQSTSENNSSPTLKQARHGRRPKPRKLFIIEKSTTNNWPSGECEDWVACVPHLGGDGGHCGILKRRSLSSTPIRDDPIESTPQRFVSPTSSPSHSPPLKKKRVSFLDPPVSKGLLYNRDGAPQGQLQHAYISPTKLKNISLNRTETATANTQVILLDTEEVLESTTDEKESTKGDTDDRTCASISKHDGDATSLNHHHLGELTNEVEEETDCQSAPVDDVSHSTLQVYKEEDVMETSDQSDCALLLEGAEEGGDPETEAKQKEQLEHATTSNHNDEVWKKSDNRLMSQTSQVDASCETDDEVDALDLERLVKNPTFVEKLAGVATLAFFSKLSSLIAQRTWSNHDQ